LNIGINNNPANSVRPNKPIYCIIFSYFFLGSFKIGFIKINEAHSPDVNPPKWAQLSTCCFVPTVLPVEMKLNIRLSYSIITTEHISAHRTIGAFFNTIQFTTIIPAKHATTPKMAPEAPTESTF